MRNTGEALFHVSWHVEHIQDMLVSFPHLAFFLITVSQNSQQSDLILCFGTSPTPTP